jgi:endonuclease/exonuclease/phosphatase (EEP) superfamily protein YafD
MQTMHTNHGGICLFYKLTFSAHEVPFSASKSGLKVLAVYLLAARDTALVVVVYRPGSQTVSNSFFDDFDEVLERISTFACPVILMGDLNLYLDIATELNTIKFNSSIENHGLLQHVASPTHSAGHILDVFITCRDSRVHTIDVAPPMLSDHSLIRVTVDLQFQHGPAAHCIRRRQWRVFNCVTHQLMLSSC